MDSSRGFEASITSDNNDAPKNLELIIGDDEFQELSQEEIDRLAAEQAVQSRLQIAVRRTANESRDALDHSINRTYFRPDSKRELVYLIGASVISCLEFKMYAPQIGAITQFSFPYSMYYGSKFLVSKMDRLLFGSAPEYGIQTPLHTRIDVIRNRTKSNNVPADIGDPILVIRPAGIANAEELEPAAIEKFRQEQLHEIARVTEDVPHKALILPSELVEQANKYLLHTPRRSFEQVMADVAHRSVHQYGSSAPIPEECIVVTKDTFEKFIPKESMNGLEALRLAVLRQIADRHPSLFMSTVMRGNGDVGQFKKEIEKSLYGIMREAALREAPSMARTMTLVDDGPAPFRIAERTNLQAYTAHNKQGLQLRTIDENGSPHEETSVDNLFAIPEPLNGTDFYAKLDNEGYSSAQLANLALKLMLNDEVTVSSSLHDGSNNSPETTSVEDPASDVKTAPSFEVYYDMPNNPEQKKRLRRGRLKRIIAAKMLTSSIVFGAVQLADTLNDFRSSDGFSIDEESGDYSNLPGGEGFDFSPLDANNNDLLGQLKGEKQTSPKKGRIIIVTPEIPDEMPYWQVYSNTDALKTDGFYATDVRNIVEVGQVIDAKGKAVPSEFRWSSDSDYTIDTSIGSDLFDGSVPALMVMRKMSIPVSGQLSMKLPIKTNTALAKVRVTDNNGQEVARELYKFDDGTYAMVAQGFGEDATFVTIDYQLVPSDTNTVRASEEFRPQDIDELQLSNNALQLINDPAITQKLREGMKYDKRDPGVDAIIADSKTLEEMVSRLYEHGIGDCSVSTVIQTVLLNEHMQVNEFASASGYLNGETQPGAPSFLQAGEAHELTIDADGNVMDATSSQATDAEAKRNDAEKAEAEKLGSLDDRSAKIYSVNAARLEQKAAQYKELKKDQEVDRIARMVLLGSFVASASVLGLYGAAEFSSATTRKIRRKIVDSDRYDNAYELLSWFTYGNREDARVNDAPSHWSEPMRMSDGTKSIDLPSQAAVITKSSLVKNAKPITDQTVRSIPRWAMMDYVLGRKKWHWPDSLGFTKKDKRRADRLARWIIDGKI